MAVKHERGCYAIVRPSASPSLPFLRRFGLRTGRGARTRLPEGTRIVSQTLAPPIVAGASTGVGARPSGLCGLERLCERGLRAHLLDELALSPALWDNPSDFDYLKRVDVVYEHS